MPTPGWPSARHRAGRSPIRDPYPGPDSGAPFSTIRSSEQSAPELAIALCWNLERFWHLIYWHRPALDYLKQALAGAERSGIVGEPLDQLHRGLGYAYEAIRDTPNARKYYQKYYEKLQTRLAAREAAREDDSTLLPLRRSLAGLLHNLGNLATLEEHLDEAQQYFQSALVINRAIDNDAWRGFNLQGLFVICIRKGILLENPSDRQALFELARSYAEEGVTIYRRNQESYHLCLFLHSQTYALQLLGDYESALPLMEEGFALAIALENWTTACAFLTAYYTQTIATRRWEEAAQLLGAISALSQRWELELDERDNHLFPQANLPELLGQAYYDRLCETGANASQDALRKLTAQIFR